VVADATLVSAQDNLASSAQASQLEARELLLEESLAGGLSLQILAQAQAYLSSTPAECDSLSGYFASLTASSSASGDDSGIAYAASAVAGAATASSPVGDNLTVVAPFAGEVHGALNLQEALSIREAGGGGSVSLKRNETHVLNVPIEVDSASSLCHSTLGSLGSALSRSPCNATLEEAAFDAVLPGLVAGASALRFILTAGWAPGAACSAAYWVTLVEPGVAGATGSFDWTVRGSGTTA
jgi:hypothetical protein